MTKRELLDSESTATKHIKQHKRLEKSAKQRRVGNFRSYYSYRLGQKHQDKLEDDPRLKALEKNWFESKRGLDIGCNSGELTIAIAERLAPSYILGMDVDPQLISTARGHLKKLLRQKQSDKAHNEIATRKTSPDDGEGAMESLADVKSEEKGPADEENVGSTNLGANDAFADDASLLFELWKPPLKTRVAEPCAIGKSVASSKFPLNVVFKQEDVMSDAHAGKDYDFITCFSVTKWIHLFHGDEGIRKVFKKIYELLVPGGRLILEPQPWKSYHKRKFTSEITAANYPTIQLRPKDFPKYLVDSIGFQSCDLLEVCQTSSKGFRRPVYVAQK